MLFTQGRTQHIEGSREGQVLGCGGHGRGWEGSPAGTSRWWCVGWVQILPLGLIRGVRPHNHGAQVSSLQSGDRNPAPLPTWGGGRAL